MTSETGTSPTTSWRLRTGGPERTRALGRALGRAALPGTVILLAGELGAGKTVLAQGVASGLETPGVVNSPTFVLLNEHLGGRLALQHADLYRLTSPDEVEELGLHEAAQEAVLVVEWPDRAEGGLPRDQIEVAIAPGDGPDERVITLEARGATATAVLAAARAASDG